MSSKQGDDEEDPLVLVAAVTWELPTGISSRSKLKVHRSDCTSSEGVLKGRDLERLLRRQTQLQAQGTLHQNLLIEIYDASQSAHVSLNELLDENLVQRFQTTRLRIQVHLQQDDKEVPLAICGRFYSYDAQEGVTIAGQQLRVQELPNQENAGTGVNVWDGALLLAQYLEKEPHLVQNKRVLELGSGCGLVGLAAATLGARELLLTDLPYSLPNLQANIDRHAHLLQDNQVIKCHALDWFHPPKELGTLMKREEWTPEVILIADCVWMQELVEPLLNTLQQLASNDTQMKVVISYQRRGKSTHEAFWTGLHCASRFPTATVTEIRDSGLHIPDVLHLLCLEFGNNDHKE